MPLQKNPNLRPGAKHLSHMYFGGDDKKEKPLYGNKQWGNKIPWTEDNMEDLGDYETYAYEFSSQVLLRSSPPGAGGKTTQPNKSVLTSSHKQLSPQIVRTLQRFSPTSAAHKARILPQSARKTYASGHGSAQRAFGSSQKSVHKQERHSEPSYFSNLHPDDLVYLGHAATKIQAAFRGYKCRKEYWKKREQMRREKDFQKKIIRNDIRISLEDAPASSTINIGEDYKDYNLCVLARNADPNLGLVPFMLPIDSGQKNHILREWKLRTSFSDDIPTITQIQDEAGPCVLIMGGINPFAAKDYFLGGALFVYNPQRDKWFFVGTMPEPRNYHSAAYLHGKVYIIGGYSPFQNSNGEMVATPSTFQLTVRSKRWRKRADMHQSRACHGIVIVDDSVLVIGGRDNTGTLLSTVELYDTTRDHWTLVKSLPEPLMGMGVCALEGLIWVIGGITNEGHSTRYAVSSRVYCFDPVHQSWFRKPSLPEPRAFCAATTLRREIWVWGGVKDTLSEDGRLTSTGIVYVFNPEVAKWEQHFCLSTPKHAMAIAKAGRRIYILGGVTSVTKEALTENDMYDREHDTLRDGAALPRPLAGCCAVGLPTDYLAKNENKWIGVSADRDIKDLAATKIQALYRGYSTRSSLAQNRHLRYISKCDMDNLGNGGVPSAYFGFSGRGQLDDQWKAMPSVTIPEWPPRPNPNSSSSTINVSLGGLPPGYTIVPVSTGTRVRRFITLPNHVDPNLGIIGYLDDSYKKAKKVLGLRRADPLPSFAHSMRSAEQLQDDSVPVVVLTGGLEPRDPLNQSYGKTVLKYHPLKDRLEFVGLMPEARNHHSAVIVNDVIYITGGYDPEMRNCGEMVATKTTFCLNIHTVDWVQKADMQCARAHHGLVHHKGKLYAIGGRDNNGRLVASLEEYHLEEDKWVLLRPMLSPRMGMACTVYEDAIWCLGGVGGGDPDDETALPILASVIAYDPSSDTWSTRPPLRCPRAYATALVIEHALWLCGGCSKSRSGDKLYLLSMGSVDCYNAAEAEWERRTVISSPRHCAVAVAVESCIYVFGGISSQEWNALCRNEMVIITDYTTHTCRDLPVPLTGISAVTIPPVIPALRSVSLSCLLHRKLTL